MGRCGVFLLGALPVLLLTAWFKIAIAPRDPLAGHMAVNLAEDLANAGRWLHIAAGFLKHAWELGIYPAPRLAILALAAVLLRLRPRGARCLAPWIALTIAVAGYFFVFMLTADDVDWLLATALDRLYFQLWPALVLAVFLTVRYPEEFGLVDAISATGKKPKNAG